MIDWLVIKQKNNFNFFLYVLDYLYVICVIFGVHTRGRLWGDTKQLKHKTTQKTHIHHSLLYSYHHLSLSLYCPVW